MNHSYDLFIKSLSQNEQMPLLNQQMIQNTQMTNVSNSSRQNIEENKYPYTCEYENCLKKFKAKKSLVDHTRIHKGEKPYVCLIYQCEKKFTQYSSLQKHKRTHTGERPYPCSYDDCQNAFTQLSNLKRHLRTHEGVKPFICEICQKNFSSQSNLKQHQQTHATQNFREKFTCDNCGKIYFYQSSLRKHQKNNHNKCRDDKVEHQLMKQPKTNQMWNSEINQKNKQTQNDIHVNYCCKSDHHNCNSTPSNSVSKITLPTIHDLNKLEAVIPHLHKENCVHFQVMHKEHVDYLWEGYLIYRNPHGNLEFHQIEHSEKNPETCQPVYDQSNETPQCEQGCKEEYCGSVCNEEQEDQDQEFQEQKLLTEDLQLYQEIERQFNSYMINKSLDEELIFQDDNTMVGTRKLKRSNSDHCNCKSKQQEQHLHDKLCGHLIVYHNGHVDYIVEGRLHHPHEGHCDDHGPISVVKQIQIKNNDIKSTSNNIEQL